MAAAKKAAAPKAAPKAAPAAAAAAPAAGAAPEGADTAQDPGADQDLGDELDQAEAIKPGEGEVFVLARKGLGRFHRCGMRFVSDVPTVLVAAELDEGVLERLKAEPNLVVVEG